MEFQWPSGFQLKCRYKPSKSLKKAAREGEPSACFAAAAAAAAAWPTSLLSPSWAPALHVAPCRTRLQVLSQLCLILFHLSLLWRGYISRLAEGAWEIQCLQGKRTITAQGWRAICLLCCCCCLANISALSFLGSCSARGTLQDQAPGLTSRMDKHAIHFQGVHWYLWATSSHTLSYVDLLICMSHLELLLNKRYKSSLAVSYGRF
ncbi:uncharacterized protein LOC133376536 [Rhineura floridana]|uniref:uncharacterized protein LOC133376536 n=1 Tax=Rhineura floridana TaxID=261503 RepID=UPI002AC7FF59|nr:uncharacterized protein LOC133376536 [Rhineura floridana]